MKHSLISKFLLRSMLAAMHFFPISFAKLGRKPAFPSLSETTKRLKTQPIWHSHLGEPPDGHAGFICHINIQFIAEIQPFSLAVF